MAVIEETGIVQCKSLVGQRVVGITAIQFENDRDFYGNAAVVHGYGLRLRHECVTAAAQSADVNVVFLVGPQYGTACHQCCVTTDSHSTDSNGNGKLVSSGNEQWLK